MRWLVKSSQNQRSSDYFEAESGHTGSSQPRRPVGLRHPSEDGRVILYLDVSVLVKRYIQEKASQDVSTWIEAADLVVTGLITRIEVAAAIARAGRMKLIPPDETLAALRQFRSE